METPTPLHLPTIERRHIATLGCMLCGDTAGTLHASTWPAPSLAEFHPQDGAPVAMISWRRLRCPRCGGGLIPQDVESVVVRIEPPATFEDDLPRRGRPPKWLVRARLAAIENLSKAG